MARELGPDGRIVTLERDPERIAQALDFWARGGVADRIELVAGDALASLERLAGPFDLVFLDAGKTEIDAYLERLEGRLAPHAMLVVDNLLMSGEAALPEGLDTSWGEESLRAARRTTKALMESPDVAVLAAAGRRRRRAGSPARYRAHMSLRGPSKTIVVEPLKAPAKAPAPRPRRPRRSRAAARTARERPRRTSSTPVVAFRAWRVVDGALLSPYIPCRWEGAGDARRVLSGEPRAAVRPRLAGRSARPAAPRLPLRHLRLPPPRDAAVLRRVPVGRRDRHGLGPDRGPPRRPARRARARRARSPAARVPRRSRGASASTSSTPATSMRRPRATARRCRRRSSREPLSPRARPFVVERRRPTPGGTMRYALLIFEKPGAYDPLERRRAHGRSRPSTWRSAKDPRIAGGAHLRPPDTATTRPRRTAAELLTTDGPFADTKEVFGGWFVFEADDLDAALEVAGRIPAVRMGGSRRGPPGRGAGAADRRGLPRRVGAASLAALVGALRDFDLAEDAAQEAFAIAAERWPREGAPANPGAWLVTTARNRAIDRLRRERDARGEGAPARRAAGRRGRHARRRRPRSPTSASSSSSPAAIRRSRPRRRSR